MFRLVGDHLATILDQCRVRIAGYRDPDEDPTLAEDHMSPCDAVSTAPVTASSAGPGARQHRHGKEPYQCPFPTVTLRSLLMEPEEVTYRDFPEGSTSRFYGECVANWELAKQMGVSRQDFLSSQRTPDGATLTLSTFRGYQKMWKVRLAAEKERRRFRRIKALLMQRFSNDLAERSRYMYVQQIERAMISMPSVQLLERFLQGPSSLPKKRAMLTALGAAFAVDVEVIPGLHHSLISEWYAKLSSETKIIQGNGRRTQREREGWVSEAELLAASETLLSNVPADGDAAAVEIVQRLQRYVFWRMFIRYPCRLATRTLTYGGPSGNTLQVENDTVRIHLEEYKTVRCYGAQDFVIEDGVLIGPLRRLLAMRQEGDYVFRMSNGQPYSLPVFSRHVASWMREIIERPITVQIARKALATATWGQELTANRISDISRNVYQHSVTTHLEYYKLLQDVEDPSGSDVSEDDELAASGAAWQAPVHPPATDSVASPPETPGILVSQSDTAVDDCENGFFNDSKALNSGSRGGSVARATPRSKRRASAAAKPPAGAHAQPGLATDDEEVARTARMKARADAEIAAAQAVEAKAKADAALADAEERRCRVALARRQLEAQEQAEAAARAEAAAHAEAQVVQEATAAGQRARDNAMAEIAGTARADVQARAAERQVRPGAEAEHHQRVKLVQYPTVELWTLVPPPSVVVWQD
ncbi:hypothetical protein CXG81DRAFT_21454, partial [Caulochytrium protostelioides]